MGRVSKNIKNNYLHMKHTFFVSINTSGNSSIRCANRPVKQHYMKRISQSLAILSCLILASCTKAEMITDLPADINKTTTTTTQPNSFKRGSAFSTGTSIGSWNNNVVNLKSNWYYTWGLNSCTDPKAPSNVEFVPMFWGHSSVTQANVDIINQLYRQGKIFYVLGFNEPDLTAESNMSVAQALEDWKFLSDNLDKGIKLVSPAGSWPGVQWFKDFMTGVQQQGLRLDHIALHIYMGQSPSTYTNQVQNIYALYGKKIWITEFAPRDDSAVSGQPTTNHYSAQWILDNFMTSLLPQLENMDAVYRYSWFSGSPTMAGLWTSMLVDGTGNLTVLGNYYKTLNPNNLALVP